MGDIPPLGGLSVNDNAPQAATTFNDLPPDVVDAVLERYLEKIEVDKLCEARLLEICMALRGTNQCNNPDDPLWKAACARLGLTERLVGGVPGAPATPTWHVTFLAMCNEVAKLKTYHLVIRENLMDWNEARGELSEGEIERRVAKYKTSFLNAYKRLLKGENPITYEEARELEHETGLRSESDDDEWTDRETYTQYERRTYYRECLVSEEVDSDLLCFRKEVEEMIPTAGHLGLRCMLHYLLRRLQGIFDEQSIEEAMESASQNGHLAAVEELLAVVGMSYPDSMQELLHPALRGASENGHLAVVEMLVAAGVDLKGVPGGFALREASENGHLAVVEFLLAHGAILNLNYLFNETALMKASENGHLAVVKALIAAGADVNQTPAHNARRKGPALIWASKNGHLAIVKFLLAHGADVNIIGSIRKDSYDPTTALLEASENGHLAIVELLLAAGADVNAGGGRALANASCIGHLAIVKLLLEAGVDVNARNERGFTALECASDRGDLAVLEVLLAHGADVNQTAHDARRKKPALALCKAVERGHLAAVEILLAHGADVHADDDRALRDASRNGHLAIAKALIAAGADVHARDDASLLFASASGHAAVVELLLAHGADAHARDGAALRYARSRGYAAVVEVLRAAGETE